MSTETPCIGVCSTIYGDVVCRGCKRNYQEVIDWNGFDNQKKLAILSRLEKLTSKIVSQYFQITDVELLRSKCEKFAVKYRPEFSPLCWVYSLLHVGADKIKDVSKYGIKVQEKFIDLPLTKVFELMDDEIYEAAQALYKASE